MSIALSSRRRLLVKLLRAVLARAGLTIAAISLAPIRSTNCLAARGPDAARDGASQVRQDQPDARPLNSFDWSRHTGSMKVGVKSGASDALDGISTSDSTKLLRLALLDDTKSSLARSRREAALRVSDDRVHLHVVDLDR